MPKKTDSTRAQDTELKIQHRLNTELSRIRDAQAQQLSDLAASLTTKPPSSTPTSSKADSDPGKRDPNTLAAHLSSPFYQDHSPTNPSGPSAGSTPATTPTADSGRSHDSVQKEIMSLRAKLDARKKVEQVSPEVEKAREGLVQCLRAKDRRPLDCWREVEMFKAEVGKLERGFVERVGR